MARQFEVYVEHGQNAVATHPDLGDDGIDFETAAVDTIASVLHAWDADCGRSPEEARDAEDREARVLGIFQRAQRAYRGDFEDIPVLLRDVEKAAAAVERCGGDFSHGKPDQSDLVRAALVAVGYVDADMDEGLIEDVSNVLFDDCGTEVTSALRLAAYVLWRAEGAPEITVDIEAVEPVALIEDEDSGRVRPMPAGLFIRVGETGHGAGGSSTVTLRGPAAVVTEFIGRHWGPDEVSSLRDYGVLPPLLVS